MATITKIKELIANINAYKNVSRTLNHPENKQIVENWINKLNESIEKNTENEKLYNYINIQFLLIQTQEYSMREYANAFKSIFDVHKLILEKMIAQEQVTAPAPEHVPVPEQVPEQASAPAPEQELNNK